jgi:NAD(P)-dependent dehydrogenase (short-subunit alcohol dehydrogenase family)
MRIDGCSAIVTGGASGLGRASAAELSRAGASVVVVDLPRPGNAEAVASLGDGLTFLPGDITEEDVVCAAVQAAGERVPLRIVVNCAGVAPPGRVINRDGPLPLDAFEAVVRVNLFGTFNVIRLVASAMQDAQPIDGERGVIVNTASIAAFDGQIGQPAYAASKGGIAAMTLPIAREFAGSLIRVVTIAPGPFSTPMMAALPHDARASLARQVPHPSRLGEPSEYAALVRHIVENPMLNGEVIRLDGAIRMAPR